MDRIAAGRPPEQVVPDETRRWAEENGVYLAGDDVLALIHREHPHAELTPEEVRQWAKRLGVDLPCLPWSRPRRRPSRDVRPFAEGAVAGTPLGLSSTCPPM
jgi:hypothetical protein